MPSSLMDYNADRFKKTGKSPAFGRGKKATKKRAKMVKKAIDSEKPRKMKGMTVRGGKKAYKKEMERLKKDRAGKKSSYRQMEMDAEAAKKAMSGRGSISPEKAKKIRDAGKKHKMEKKNKQDVYKKHQKKKSKKAGLILADTDTAEAEETEPGAMDDDAKKRMRKKKKMLEEAAG